MRTQILKAIGGTLAALALATAPAYAGTTTGAATGNTTRTGILACGYYEEGGESYYNHCGTTSVVIRVERWLGLPGSDWCVAPGTTWLGHSFEIKDAWYKGRLC
ncbi:DUF6355 family natural product biosynthesis protein [Spongiactinospora sp. TRM90649]|uniref:DUF6355 family natural product biosynthesis protein n=1 Tax=Spongiactinospora sp. TRM90649 TaxID=3031114 RepID=UPI0023F97F18|nr:DUF6355 family natural product biosynthesis protein [Spongiactinospora sp. TRM90649]MDF5751722.1 DUF6355 family natural product biosynthesis protein [Spongiactinospora sp. TRM90649]